VRQRAHERVDTKLLRRYYAYWNLFHCTFSLSLYNYKLSGVTDGPLSFAKAMTEVAEAGNLEKN
jgi:hypothetical protein